MEYGHEYALNPVLMLRYSELDCPGLVREWSGLLAADGMLLLNEFTAPLEGVLSKLGDRHLAACCSELNEGDVEGMI